MSEPTNTVNLDAIFSEHEALLSDGSRVAIHKLKVKYIKRALDTVARIVSGLSQKTVGVDDIMSVSMVAGFSLTPSVLLQLISNNWDEVFELIALHTSLDKEKIGELDIDDGLIIFAGVIRRNADFFVQNVVPLMVALAANAASDEKKATEPQEKSSAE